MSRRKYKFYILQALCAAVMLSVLLSLSLVGASAAESGKCGDSLTWSFNAGTLTISGSGDMDDYRDSSLAPWYELREQIVRLELSEGITSIGEFAFFDCEGLKSLVLPNSVKDIGEYAFGDCIGISSVTLGKLLKSIGEGAFKNCSSITTLRLPEGLEAIGKEAFFRCESLSVVTIGKNVRQMGSSAFAYCKNLVRAEINAPLTQIPQWTFYGCDRLVVVSLGNTVEKIDNNALEGCTSLSNVYYSGNEEKGEKIKEELAKALPDFGKMGYVSNGVVKDTATATAAEKTNDNRLIVSTTTVKQNDNITLEYTVHKNYPTAESTTSQNTFNIVLTVEDNKGWSEAIEQIKKPVSEMNTLYANADGSNKINIELYMKNDTELSEDFLVLLSGRDVRLEVMSPDGSVWRFEGENIEAEKTAPDVLIRPAYDFSYKLEEADKLICEKMETEDCYKVTFKEDVTTKAEVLVQLPGMSHIRENAFLYQQEKNGSYTRLQAVQVDESSNAHFYVASIKKDTQYFIGINVPGEKTSDVIVPEELLSSYGTPLERLETIEYVETGERSLGGWSLWQVMAAVLGIIAAAIALIGGVMFLVNKKKTARNN